MSSTFMELSNCETGTTCFGMTRIIFMPIQIWSLIIKEPQLTLHYDLVFDLKDIDRMLIMFTRPIKPQIIAWEV